MLGGWVGVEVGPHILTEVREEVANNALKPASKNLRIELAQFGEDAINLGAATLALQDFLANSERWSKQVKNNQEKLVTGLFQK